MTLEDSFAGKTYSVPSDRDINLILVTVVSKPWPKRDRENDQGLYF